MGATDSMTSVRRRSLALRTMAGVVAVVALALAALMVTTLGIAGHVVTSQLRDTLTESWRRTSSFVSNTGPVPGASLPGFKDPGGGSGSTNTNSSNTGSSPTDTATKNPINAPGLPAGGIVMVIGSDGTVSSAGHIDESGQRVALDSESVSQLLDVVKSNKEFRPRKGCLRRSIFRLVATRSELLPSCPGKVRDQRTRAGSMQTLLAIPQFIAGLLMTVLPRTRRPWS